MGRAKKAKTGKSARASAIARGIRSVGAFYAREYPPTGKRFTDFLLAHRFEITLYLLFALLNLIYAAGMQYPLLTDEHVTMAEGIYLWGGADNWSAAYAGSNYYGYGYSVLYGWLYYLTQNMREVFQWSLVINSFVIAIIPVLAFRISSVYLELKKPLSFAISLAAGLYPAAVVYSKYALNETVMLLLPWLAAYMLLYLFREGTDFRKNLPFYALLGLLSMYAYTVHGRGIAIFGVAFLCVLFIAIKNRKGKYWLNLLIFLAAAALWFLIDRAVKANLMANFFQTGAGEANNTLERVLTVNMAGAFSPENIGAMLSGFLGQGLYMMCATFGLLAVGGVAFAGMLRGVKRAGTPQQRNLFLLFVFAALFALASIVISTAFLSGIYVSNEAVRSEYYVYGRYNETACLFIAFVVIALLSMRKKLSKKSLIASLIIFGGVVAGGCCVAAPKIAAAGGNISYNMVPSILPFMGFEAWIGGGIGNFVALGLIISAIFAALLLLFWKGRRRAAFILLLCCFVYSFNYSLFAFVYPISEKRYETVKPFEIYAQQNDGLWQSYPRVYVDFFSAPVLGVQFAMPEFELSFLEKDAKGYDVIAEMEPQSTIISKHNEIMDEIFSDIYQVSANERTHVWVYGEELANEMRARGYNVYQNKPDYSYEYAVDTLQTTGSMEGGAVVLQSGQEQFGPYANTMPGTYTVDIYGENLDKASFRLQENGGNAFSVVTDFTVFEPGHVAYTFTSGGFADNIEFVTRNDSADTVKIDRMSLNLTQPMERVPAAQAGIFTYMYRDFGMETSDLYRGSDFSFSKNSIKGQSGLLMPGGADMRLSGLKFNPGSHQVIVYGDNVDAADIGFDAEQPFTVSDVRKYEDRVVFTLDTEGYIKNGTLFVTNKTDEEMTYRGVAANVLYLKDVPGVVWQRAI